MSRELNSIRFDIKHSECGDVVVPEIDGRSLLSILRDVEGPMSKEEGNPTLAGAYEGLLRGEIGSALKHYLGNGRKRFRSERKTAILGCNCGEPGCWPFLVSIVVDNKFVHWSEFEQPHRRNWNYDGLQPLVLDRHQYETAVMAVR